MKLIKSMIGATVGFCVGGPVGAIAGVLIANDGTNGDSFDV